jgi:hypothetical protein
MAYSDFDVIGAESRLGIRVVVGDVFPPLTPVPVPAWLADTLARGSQLRVVSEKARNEFIVAPILLAVRELSGNAVAIFSGESFDVDRSAGLAGEVDFLLTMLPTLPTLPVIRAPVFTMVEAKRQDIDSGLGQCIAQMVGAQRYNERNERAGARVYGCVTTGEDWQFLRLDGSTVVHDATRLYRNDIGRILAVFLHAVAENTIVVPAA